MISLGCISMSSGRLYFLFKTRMISECFATFQVSPNSSAAVVVCECHHFSVFSANMLKHPNKLDPFKLSLFIGVFKNPLVLILVICAWCIYALLLVWAWRKDYNDIMKVTTVLFNYNIVLSCH